MDSIFFVSTKSLTQYSTGHMVIQHFTQLSCNYSLSALIAQESQFYKGNQSGLAGSVVTSPVCLSAV